MVIEGDDSPGGGVSTRIDELLSSAIEDQAREQRMMLETVQAARAAVELAQRDLADLRDMINKREQAVADLLEARLAGVSTQESVERLGHRIDLSLMGTQQSLERVEEIGEKTGAALGQMNETAMASHQELLHHLETSVAAIKFDPLTERMAAVDAKLTLIEGFLAPLDPAEATANLNRSLGELFLSRLTPVESALREMLEHLSQLATPMGEVLAKAVEQAGEPFERSVLELRESVASALESSARVSEEVSAASARVAERVEGAMETLGKQVSSAMEAQGHTVSSSLALGQGVLAERFEETSRLLAERVAEAATEAGAQTSEQVARHLEETISSMAAALSQMGIDLGSRFDSADAWLAALGQAVTERLESGDRTTANLVGDLNAGLEEVRASLELLRTEVSADLRQTQTAMGETASRIAREVESAADSMRHDVAGALQDAAGSVEDRVNVRLNEASVALREAFEERSAATEAQVAAVAETIRRTGESVESGLLRLNEAADLQFRQTHSLVAEARDVGLQALSGLEARQAEASAAALTAVAADLKDSIDRTAARTFDRLQQVLVEAGSLRELVESVPGSVGEKLEEDRAASQEAGAALSRQLEHLRSVLESRLPQFEASISARLEEAGGAISMGFADLRAGVNEQLGGVRSSVDERFPAIEESVSGGLQQVRMSIEEYLPGIEEAIGAKLHEVRSAISEFLPLLAGNVSGELAGIKSAVDERLPEIERAMSNQVLRVRQELKGQVPELASTVGSILEPFAQEMSKLQERVRQANMRISESNSRVEALQESLITYLAGRDEKMEESRGEVLSELIVELGSSLRRRDRARLADALREAEERRRDRRDAERFRKQKVASEPPAERVEEVRRVLTDEVAAGGADDAAQEEPVVAVQVAVSEARETQPPRKARSSKRTSSATVKTTPKAPPTRKPVKPSPKKAPARAKPASAGKPAAPGKPRATKTKSRKTGE